MSQYQRLCWIKATTRRSRHHSNKEKMSRNSMKDRLWHAGGKEIGRAVGKHNSLLHLRTRKSNRYIHFQTASEVKDHKQPPSHKWNILKYSLFIKNQFAFPNCLLITYAGGSKEWIVCCFFWQIWESNFTSH